MQKKQVGGIRGKIIGGVVAVVLLAAAVPAVASAWEWYNWTSLQPAQASPYLYDLNWEIETTGNYVEYRTAFIAIVSSSPNGAPGAMPPIIPGNWQEQHNCRHKGLVTRYNPVQEGCQVDIETVPHDVSSTMWVRYTTNYAGCGTYTLTPGANCGDSDNRSIIVQ